MITIILTAGGSILLLLLSVIGFFLRQLYASIKEMKKSITELRLDISLYNAGQKQFGKDLIKVEMRVDEHEKRIEDNKESIIRLESEQNNCPARSKHKNKAE